MARRRPGTQARLRALGEKLTSCLCGTANDSSAVTSSSKPRDRQAAFRKRKSAREMKMPVECTALWGLGRIGRPMLRRTQGGVHLFLAALLHHSQPGFIVPMVRTWFGSNRPIRYHPLTPTAYLKVLSSSNLIKPAPWSLLSPLQRTILAPARLDATPIRNSCRLS